MKLRRPKFTISEMGHELDAINGNVFQLKAFATYIVKLIEEGKPIEDMKKVVDVFKPLEAIKNLEAE